MKETEDLFGEKRIQIKGDAYLNKIAQHIYDLVTREPELLTGDSIGNINRKIHLAVMMSSGLALILTASGYKVEAFKSFYLSKACPTEEECARATRELLAEDFIRLPAKIIRQSEQFKNRIASKMR